MKVIPVFISLIILFGSHGEVPLIIAGNREVQETQWHLDYLQVRKVDEHGQGDGVVVGMIDTGIDASHPDLAGSVLDGTDMTIEGPASMGKRDVSGHGTAMAGLVAAHGLTRGLAPKAKLLPVRNGVGLGRGIAEPLDWAVRHGVKVICIAQGGDSNAADAAAVKRAIAADVVVVAASGNNYPTVEYPAAYPGVVAVAGVDRQGERADFSTAGPQVSIAAPAVDIRTTGLSKGYDTIEGTSPATAIVAGVAALIRAKYPDLSAEEVIHRLTATAVDKGPKGRDSEYGYGIVDPVAALTADVPPLEGPPSPSPDTAAPPRNDDVLDRVVLFGGIGLAVLILIGGLVLARRRH